MTNIQSEFFEKTFLSYLNKHFTPWNLNTFSPDHTAEIYSELEVSIPMEELLNADHHFKKHLISYFQNIGSLEVTIEAFKHISIMTDINEDTIKSFKLLKHYQAHFQNTEDSNLLIIDEKITKLIFDQLENDQDSFRDHIRTTLPFVEELGTSYAILFGRSRITVRKDLNAASREKRFSGLPAQELEGLMLKYFKNIDEELPALIENHLKEHFRFQSMSNQEFESSHIKILQEGILKLIKKRSRQDKEVMTALTNYILRQKFDMLHMMIAQQLVTNIINKDRKAEQFLYFYTQGLIIIGGQKYEIPPLQDSQGKVWSVANIINVAGQYQGFKQTFDKKSAHIESMDKTLDGIDQEIFAAATTIKKIKSGGAQNHQELTQVADKIRNIRHTFQSQGDTLQASQKAALTQTVSALEDKERKLMIISTQFEKGVSQASKDYTDLKYKKTTTAERYNIEIDRLDELEALHKEIIDKHNMMLTAVAKALTSKKTKVPS